MATRLVVMHVRVLAADGDEREGRQEGQEQGRRQRQTESRHARRSRRSRACWPCSKRCSGRRRSPRARPRRRAAASGCSPWTCDRPHTTVPVAAVEEHRGAGRRRPVARAHLPARTPRASCHDRVLPRRRLGDRRRGHARQPVPHALPRGGGRGAERRTTGSPRSALPRRSGGLLRRDPLGRRARGRAGRGRRTHRRGRRQRRRQPRRRGGASWPATTGPGAGRPAPHLPGHGLRRAATPRRPRTPRATS